MFRATNDNGPKGETPWALIEALPLEIVSAKINTRPETGENLRIPDHPRGRLLPMP